MLEGIDVSKWQGTVNWSSVASAGVSFAVARSSLGMQTTDWTFVNNYKQSVAAGLVPGAYHVVAADSTGAQNAANWKAQLDVAGFDKGLLVIDVEAWEGTNSSTVSAVLTNVKYLCDWVRSTYNRTPIIYTGYYWRDILKQPANNFGALLWLAAYVTDPTPYVPTAWSDWTIWQYTGSGSVAGVTGDVDRDKYRGTLRDIKGLAGWEWDELATQEEITQIVHTEVAAAIAAGNANTNTVVSAINTNANAMADEFDATTAAITAAATDIKQDAAMNTVRITDAVSTSQDAVVTQLSSLIEAIDPTTASDEVKALVTKLHRHLCLPCTADNLQ